MDDLAKPDVTPAADPLAKFNPTALERAYTRAEDALRAQGQIVGQAPYGSLGREKMPFAEARKIPGEVERIIEQGASPRQNLGLPNLDQVELVGQAQTQIAEADTRAKDVEAQTRAFTDYTLSETGASLSKDPTTGAYSIKVDATHPFQVSKRLKAEREKAALEGTLPIPGALENDIKQQEQRLRASLLEQVGPGWETSTPGIQALQEFNKRANETRDSARRGDIQQFAGLSAAARGEAGAIQPNLAYANLYGQSAGQTQGLLNYQVGQQQFGLSAHLQRQALEAERERTGAMERGALWGAAGQAVGLAGSTYFGGGRGKK